MHLLTIEYEGVCPFSGRAYTRTKSFRLCWEGVQRVLAEPFWRERNARFSLHPYWGQPTDN